MKILISGGAGFVGTNLTINLLNEGHEVMIIDNFITGSVDNLIVHKNNKHLTVRKCDIVTGLPQIVLQTKFEEIYHLACPTGVPNLTTLAKEMLLSCALGTKHIIDLALRSKAKLLLTSSSEAYGNPLVHPQSESYTGNVDPTGVRSPYEEGKRFAESLVATYSRLYGLDGKIVRVFNTYGPNMSKSDTRVIPMFLRAAISGKPIPIHGDGLQTRTYCYIDDLISGLKLVMRKGTKAEVYNIGGTKEITVLRLAQIIKQLTKSQSPLTHTLRPAHDHMRRKPDIRKIQILGWSAHTSLVNGLRKSV